MYKLSAIKTVMGCQVQHKEWSQSHCDTCAWRQAGARPGAMEVLVVQWRAPQGAAREEQASIPANALNDTPLTQKDKRGERATQFWKLENRYEW